MLLVIVLVCAIGGTTCDQDSALDAIPGPKVNNPIACLQQGQQLAATLEHMDRAKEYARVECRRLTS